MEYLEYDPHFSNMILTPDLDVLEIGTVQHFVIGNSCAYPSLGLSGRVPTYFQFIVSYSLFLLPVNHENEVDTSDDEIHVQ
jgi:hypothetical protein